MRLYISCLSSLFLLSCVDIASLDRLERTNPQDPGNVYADNHSQDNIAFSDDYYSQPDIVVNPDIEQPEIDATMPDMAEQVDGDTVVPETDTSADPDIAPDADVDNYIAPCPTNNKFCHKISGSALKWSDAAPDKKNWNDAKAYCSGMNGRLPTIGELRILVRNCDKTQTGGTCGVIDSCTDSSKCSSADCSNGCAVDESGKYSYFNDTLHYWSSSAVSNNTGNAWLLFYANASIYDWSKTGTYGVRCVSL